jgi:hypothetical protein
MTWILRFDSVKDSVTKLPEGKIAKESLVIAVEVWFNKASA